jgi:hypothetical protein
VHWGASFAAITVGGLLLSFAFSGKENRFPKETACFSGKQILIRSKNSQLKICRKHPTLIEDSSTKVNRKRPPFTLKARKMPRSP